MYSTYCVDEHKAILRKWSRPKGEELQQKFQKACNTQ